MREVDLLFLDIEWNQITEATDYEKNEILQIAVIGCFFDYSKEMRMAKMVKPINVDAITEKTYKLLGISKTAVQNANPAEIVFGNLLRTFKGFKVVVVWNIDSYNLFKSQAESLGFKLPKHRVVELQDIIFTLVKGIKNKPGFRKCLQMAGVSYEEKMLHHARNDVEYLYLLYRYVEERLNNIVKSSEVPVFSSVNSNVIHGEGCRYLKQVSGKNLVKRDLKDVFIGACVCNSCRMVGRFEMMKWSNSVSKKKGQVNKKKVTAGKRKITENGRKQVSPIRKIDDSYIDFVCNKFGVKYSIGCGVVFINTGRSGWRVFHDNVEVTEVFHENYHVNLNNKNIKEKKKAKVNAGYHHQEVKSKSFYEVIRYIESHDRHFFRREKKDRLEMLFEKIAMERKMKGEANYG